MTLTIDKTKSFQFKFNDIEQAQSQFNMMEGYMSIANERMMVEVNKELELEVLNNAEVTIKTHDKLGFLAPEVAGKEYYFAG